MICEGVEVRSRGRVTWTPVLPLHCVSALTLTLGHCGLLQGGVHHEEGLREMGVSSTRCSRWLCGDG